MAADFKVKTGKTLLVTSGFRTNEKQKTLFDEMVAKLNGDKAAAKKKVAEPMPPLGQGKGSFHLKGLAIDINSKGADVVGIVCLEIEGAASEITAGVQWLKKQGVRVEPVELSAVES